MSTERQVVELVIDASGAVAGSNRYVDALTKAATASERFQEIEDRATAARERAAAKGDPTITLMAERSRAYDRVRAAVDPLARAEQALERAMNASEQAVRRGSASAADAARTVDVYRQRLEAAAAGANKASAANDNLARSTDVARHHIVNLGYQLSDVAASLGSGASPFTILLQQGGQIAPILGETGVMGAVRGVGNAIRGFITPAVGIVGGLTAAVVLGYGAWSRYDDDARRVGATLEGLGRGLGLTTSQFEALARSSAAAAGLNVRQATDLATAFAATGKISPDNITKLIGVAKDAAATFGLTLDEVKEKLASSFSSAQGIDALNRQLGFLDARTQSTIDSLFRQGKSQEAIALAIGKLPPALADAERAQGAVSRAWEKIKDAAIDADAAAGRFLDRLTKGPSPEQRLTQMRQQLEMLKEAERENLVQPGSVSRTYAPPTATTVASTSVVTPEKVQTAKDYEAALKAGLERQAEMIRQGEQAAANKALEKSLNEKSQKLKELQQEVGATSDEFKKYKDWQLAADEALKSGNPELMKRVDNVRDLKEASSILEQVTTSMVNAEGQRMTAAEKASRQSAVEVAGIRATTVEGRARVAAQRQEEAQRGQLITRQQAQMQVEHAAQMVREQSAQQLRDMLRDQQLEAEEIRKRMALLGQDAESRAATIARQREEQALTRMGVDLQSELAQKVLAGAEANARLGASYDQAVAAQRRMLEGQRAIGQGLTGFLNDVLSGTVKITDALSNLSRTFVSGGLQALITGEGPFGELAGAIDEGPGLAGLFGLTTDSSSKTEDAHVSDQRVQDPERRARVHGRRVLPSRRHPHGRGIEGVAAPTSAGCARRTRA